MEFETTIHRSQSVEQRAAKGTPYQMCQEDIDRAMSDNWTEPITTDYWTLPSGAFGESCGPT